MPGYVQPTAQVPRTATDLPTRGTMQWFPERKIVWAECTQPVSRFDLLVFDMDGVGRDLTSFDLDHPWNFVHPARVAYDASTVFTVDYSLDIGSAGWALGEVIDDDDAAGEGILYAFTETATSPLLADGVIITFASAPSTAYLRGEAVVQDVTGATGTVHTVDLVNDRIFLTETTGTFSTDDDVVGQTSTAAVTPSVVTLMGVVRSGNLTFRRTEAGIGLGSAVTGQTSGATGDFDTAPAAHTQYMTPMWTYGIAQSAGQVGDRIGVQTRGVGEVSCVGSTAAGQYMIADEDLPQITPNAASADALMVIARTQTAEVSGRCWVIFNGGRGIGTNMDTE